MCALTRPIFVNFGWPSKEYPITYHHHQLQEEEEDYYSCREPIDQDQQYLISQPEIQLDRSASFSANIGYDAVAKKLYHNATERDRRKKMNDLYSALRSLLPDADQTKKLSIPATVSRVVKYLPELQQQVKRLEEKKKELLSKISTQHDDLINIVHQQKQKQVVVGSNLFSVSASKLTEREILIHISTYNTNNCPLLSEILLHLQDQDPSLLLLSASSFESVSGGRVFYSLHLQVERAYGLDCEAISEKLKSLYEKREEGTLFSSNFNLDVKIN
ncbi:Transcription factor ORG2-like [Melia azedarach]|uniref:Transcription factor ORG2-like n=1 Tax=Melia azedarach TaxID=155640 RepID=A0ACC1YKH6_MELAZ|nr:Transcription factor ORG2-like [Melia azedarach]